MIRLLTLLEVPLPKLRCKWDHMPKAIAQILFSSKCEGEREKDKKAGGEKESYSIHKWQGEKNPQNAKSIRFIVTQGKVGMTRHLPLGWEFHTGWCNVVDLRTFYESLTSSEVLQWSLSVVESIMIHQPGWIPSFYISVSPCQFEAEYSQLSDYVRKDIGRIRTYSNLLHLAGFTSHQPLPSPGNQTSSVTKKDLNQPLNLLQVAIFARNLWRFCQV